jgi:hypothetical protein
MQILQRLLAAIILFASITQVWGQMNWEYRSPMPTARQGMAAAALNDTIYVMGGAQFGHNALAVVEAYVANQDTWLINIAPLNYPRTACAAAAFEGKIYIFGGRDHNQLISQVEVYDPATNQWSPISQLPTPREGVAAAVMDSSIWVIAGSNFQSNTAIIDRYYPHSNTWDTLPYQLNQSRVAAVAGLLNGEMYVFGGYYFGPLDSYEKFTPGQGWSTEGTMLYSCGAAAGAVANSQVWIVGGEDQSGILTNVQYFEQGNWNQGPSMQSSRHKLSVAYVNNTLFAIGGQTTHMAGSVTNTVEGLSLVTGIDDNPVTLASESFYLAPNFPNPFNISTQFDVYLEKSGDVEIGVFNLLGQKVRTIYHGRLVGRKRFEFDGQDNWGNILPSGNYFIYLKTAGQMRIIKAQLVK